MFTLYSKLLVKAVKTTLHSCIVYNVAVYGTYIANCSNQEGKLLGKLLPICVRETIKMIPYKYGQRFHIKLYIYFAS